MACQLHRVCADAGREGTGHVSANRPAPGVTFCVSPCRPARPRSPPVPAAKQYAAFLSSDSVIKQIPRLLGPGLNKAGKFPTLITHQDSVEAKVRWGGALGGPGGAVPDWPGGLKAALKSLCWLQGLQSGAHC